MFQCVSIPYFNTILQRDIQAALLNLGQFDQAFKDFRSWLDGVDSMLEDVEPLYGDPKIVELELAKVRVSVHFDHSRLFLFMKYSK